MEEKEAKEIFEKLKSKAENYMKNLKEWGKEREDKEQIIFAQGYRGDLMCTAISGSQIEILSLMYDLLEEVAKKSDIDFIPMIMGFLQIYHSKSEKKSKETPET